MPLSRSKRGLASTCAVLLTLGLATAARASADGTFAPALIVDGPSTGVSLLGDVEMAFDSSAVVSYVRSDEGADHAFISMLASGAPQPPVRVDPGQPAVIGKPVAGISNGGRMTVVYANSAGLWARVQIAPGQPFSAPQQLGGPGANSPSLDMAPITGVAYLAWAENGSVRAAYLPRRVSNYTVYTGAANINPASSAGSTPELAPKVSTSADGTGVVAFGEVDGATTRIGVRRLVRGAFSSAVMSAAAESLDGQVGGSADRPAIAMQADSSFAWVVFSQSFADGARRAVVRRLRASTLEAPKALAGGAAIGAGAGPTVATNDRGSGIITVQAADGTIWASTIRRSAVTGATALGSSPAQDATAASTFAVDQFGVSAWLQAPGQEIIARNIAEDDALPTPPAFGAATTLSVPAFGAVEAAGGLDLATDRYGDSVIAFTQGPLGSRSVVVASFSLPPKPVRLIGNAFWRSSVLPPLSWWASSRGWPALGYRVYIDQKLAGTSTTTAFTPVSALAEGTHKWRVESFDRSGQVVSSSLGDLKIDTTIPKLKVKLSGSGFGVMVSGTAIDAQPPQGSGLATVKINFGDGSPSVTSKKTAFRLRHSFLRSGNLIVTVTATDRAGNKAVFTSKVKAKVKAA